MTTRAEYLASYQAWKNATREHEARMDAAIEGASVDWHFVRHEIAELQRLHEEWMEKSKPFVRWLRV
ncbi:hypothetical protein J7E70_31755 [Variovorax paradoxus]|nr:hypothetical protein [Variovorax paradoxus]MBT2304993.1 hypothetical protein [Variovorax paradoxus]